MINFLKDKIPKLKVKVMKINVHDEVIEDDDYVKQFMQEDDEMKIVHVNGIFLLFQLLFLFYKILIHVYSDYIGDPSC